MFLAVSWIAKCLRFLIWCPIIVWLNQVISPIETFFSSLPHLSSTWQSNVTLHPSQFPWWGGGIVAIWDYYIMIFSFSRFLLTVFHWSLFLTAPLLWHGTLRRCSLPAECNFSPWLSLHLFPHHITFRMCPLCLPLCVYCPVWKFFEQRYHVLLWPTVDLVCKGSLHRCQGWLIAVQGGNNLPHRAPGSSLLARPC